MSKGFSTLEILIAMTILILALSSIVLVVFGNQSILVDTETERGALDYGYIYIQEQIEKARHDFRSLVPQNATSSGMYSVSLLASSTDYVSKTIQAHITWNQEFGRKRYIDIPTLVTNYEDQGSTDTCDSILSGNWMRPNIVNTTKAMKTLLGDASGIYSVTDIDVNRDKLFVTTQNASITSPAHGAGIADTVNTSGTIAWSNPTFAQTSDNNRAQATLRGFDTTHILKLHNFDFHIPKGSSILGIKVEIERMQSGGTTGNVRDAHIRLYMETAHSARSTKQILEQTGQHQKL